MIQEMITAGNSIIRSHSVSHPYPSSSEDTSKRARRLRCLPAPGNRRIQALRSESTFAVKVATYAYPGGYLTEEVIPLGKEYGYAYGFTVVPGKVKRSSPDETLPRYMILGNYDKVFELATTYHESQAPGNSRRAPSPA